MLKSGCGLKKRAFGPNSSILSYLCSTQQALTGELQETISKPTTAILTLNSDIEHTRVSSEV